MKTNKSQHICIGWVVSSDRDRYIHNVQFDVIQRSQITIFSLCEDRRIDFMYHKGFYLARSEFRLLLLILDVVTHLPW